MHVILNTKTHQMHNPTTPECPCALHGILRSAQHCCWIQRKCLQSSAPCSQTQKVKFGVFTSTRLPSSYLPSLSESLITRFGSCAPAGQQQLRENESSFLGSEHRGCKPSNCVLVGYSVGSLFFFQPCSCFRKGNKLSSTNSRYFSLCPLSQ